MSIIDLITIDVYQNYCNNCIIKSEEKKGDTFRTCLIVKNLLFFPIMMKFGEQDHHNGYSFSPSFMRIEQKL